MCDGDEMGGVWLEIYSQSPQVPLYVLLDTTDGLLTLIAIWVFILSALIQKIYHVLSPDGLFFAEENAVADSPAGKSLQSLYMALSYICWVQIFLLFTHR